jgi:hypothetical protein
LTSFQWSDLLGQFVPALPLALALVAAGLVTVLAGAGLARLYAQVSYPVGGASGAVRAPTRSIGIGRLVSGPTASVVGSVIGLLIAGPFGQFLGNPACALGFGVGQQSFSGKESAREWGHWRSVFIAGWIGGWVGQLTSQFAFTALPSGLRLEVTVPLLSAQVPTSELFGYLVGVGVALIVKAGGRAVAIGSDVDTASAGTISGVVWLAVVSGLALAVLPFSAVSSLGGLLLGPTSNVGREITSTAIPILVGASTSLLACAVALPRVVSAQQRHATITIRRDRQNRVAGVDSFSRLGSMAWPGAFTGFLLTLVFLYAFVAGTGARVGSWLDVGAILFVGTCAGAVLAPLLTVRVGMSKAQDEIIVSVGRDGSGSFDRILLTPAPLQVIGELLFGAVTGLSLGGTAYFLILLWMRRVSAIDFLLGLILGAVLTSLLVAIFRRVQRSHIPEQPPPVSGRAG